MLTFTVHEPPNPPADRVDRAESLVFVKDGFSWMAALFAPIWLIVHRLWWALLIFVALVGGVQLVQHVGGLPERWSGLVLLAINLLVGFEADTLRRWALERKGWRTLGSVTGKTTAECERRFYETWLPSQPILAPAAAAPRAASPGWWRLGGLLGART